MTLSLVVLASGQGSNLRALSGAIEKGDCDAKIRAVMSDRQNAPAIEWAASQGFETSVVAFRSHASRDEWDNALARTIATFAPDLVVLAGFMRIVGQAVLERAPHSIINVHPALLPSFPGADAPAQAIAKGVRISGCTVHVVDRGVDTGPILAQAAVSVLPTDDAASLHERIQREEHRLLPAVIDAIARGRIALGPRPTFAADVTVGPSLQCPTFATSS